MDEPLADGSPNPQTLMELGLDPLAATVYLASLRDPKANVASMATALGIEQERVLGALDTLARLELCAIEDERISTQPPHRAIDGLIARRQQELAAAAQRLEQSRQQVGEMLDSYLDKHRSRVAEGLDLLDGEEPVRALVRAMYASTLSSLVNISPTVATPDAAGLGRPLDSNALDRQVRLRLILPSSSARDAAFSASARRAVRGGVQVRLHPAPPMKCLIFDGTTAIVPRDPLAVGDGAWVVRNPGLLQPILLLAEAAWAQGTPVEAESESLLDEPHPRTDSGPNDEARVHEVFRMLAKGLKDENIARRLGLSVRTVRRLIALGMEMLGVDSRFEAGVMAQKRGWLDG